MGPKLVLPGKPWKSRETREEMGGLTHPLFGRFPFCRAREGRCKLPQIEKPACDTVILQRECRLVSRLHSALGGPVGRPVRQHCEGVEILPGRREKQFGAKMGTMQNFFRRRKRKGNTKFSVYSGAVKEQKRMEIKNLKFPLKLGWWLQILDVFVQNALK